MPKSRHQHINVCVVTCRLEVGLMLAERNDSGGHRKEPTPELQVTSQRQDAFWLRNLPQVVIAEVCIIEGQERCEGSEVADVHAERLTSRGIPAAANTAAVAPAPAPAPAPAETQ